MHVLYFHIVLISSEMGVLYRVSVAAKNNAGQSIDEWAEIYIPQECELLSFCIGVTPESAEHNLLQTI